MHDDTKILTAIADARAASHSQFQQLKELLKRILGEVERISTPVVNNITIVAAGRTIHFPNLGEPIMPTYTLARDHAPEPFTLDAISVQDSEGNVPFTETFESDHPEVVAIDTAAALASFGTFGTATVSRKITVAGGAPVAVGEPAVFNLTPGALTITGGGVNFPGLTPDA